MLLRFSATNFGSMRDRQELSMVASPLKDPEGGLIVAPGLLEVQLLPAAIVYGANASGKSTLVLALNWLKGAVLYSHNRGEPGSEIGIRPFLLDNHSGNSASQFEIDFLWRGVRYHYGFAVTRTKYLSEWLHAYPNERRQVLFSREGTKFSFGRGLRGQNKVISELTRDNSLYLSTAAQTSHEQLTAVSEFFRSVMIDLDSASGASLSRLAETKIDKRVIEFLTGINTGVVGHRIRKSELTGRSKKFREVLQSLMAEEVEGFSLPDEKSEIELAHRSVQESSVHFSLSDESAGTRRLLVVLSEVYEALDRGSLLVIDELDASLHTQACEALVALFQSRRTNAKGAQLLTTTHDTSLLCCEGIRRDQVWFAEKDHAGATSIFPLTDIRSRRGDDLEKGYLQGRYGAIPFSGSVTSLFPDVADGQR